MEKVEDPRRKYRALSIIVILLNVYFLVSEIINFSQTKSGISLFAVLMYASTFVYLLLLEIFRLTNKSAFFAYFFTLIYLFFNALLNPFVIFFSKAGGLSTVYSLANFMPGFVAVIAYFVYLVLRIVSSLLKSFISIIKRDVYARCRNFSIIVSSIFTIMVFILNLIVTLFASIGGSDARSFDMSGGGIVFFILFYIPVVVISIYFSIHCIIGMIVTHANNKRRKRREQLEQRIEENKKIG